MLRQDNLDDLTFQAIVDQARLKIPEYISNWTDQNTHDPGIMLIELFAWLTEMQQFYLDQSEDAEAAFPLMGITKRRAAPATVSVRMLPDENEYRTAFSIPQGTPIFAEGIGFETAEPFVFGIANIAAVSTCEGEWEAQQITVLYPFGRSPETGNRLTLSFDTPFEAGRFHSLQADVYVPLPGRNPIDPDNPPRLDQLIWEYLTPNGYEPLTVEDGTYGFIADGVIQFMPPDTMHPNSDGRYEIRCTLLSHEYDVPPRIDALQPLVFTAIQKETLCEDAVCKPLGTSFITGTYLVEAGETMLFYETAGEYVRIRDFDKIPYPGGFIRFAVSDGVLPENRQFSVHAVSCAEGAQTMRILGQGTGFPNQKFRVEFKEGTIVYEDFSLLVAENYEFDHARKWYKVENFHRSLPTDRHYTLNEQNGDIMFGDGIMGAMPKGVIMASALSITHGADGNIAARQLNELHYNARNIRLEQSDPATGGRTEETVSDAMARNHGRLERAVTAEDIEKLIKQVPGLIIEDVKAFPGRTDTSDPFDPYRMIAAVKPYGDRAQLSSAYRKHIREYLEPFRLAGSEIEISSPNYARVEIIAEVTIYPRDYALADSLKEQLREFFEETYSGFGTRISRATMTTMLASYPHVERIISLSMYVSGSHARKSARGDIVLEPDTLAYWNRMDLLIR